MTAGPARRTFAPGGAWGASLNPHNRPEAGPRGYVLIASTACAGTQSIRHTNRTSLGITEVCLR